MDKSSVEAELCRLVDQFNDRIISQKDFCRIFLALKALKYKNTYLKNENGDLFLTVPYIKNILKIYESRDIPPDFY